MNDDRIISLLWIVGALVLVTSALVRRNLAGRGAVKLGLLWVGIIVIAWAGVVTVQRLLG